MKTNSAAFTLLIISLFTLFQFCNKPTSSLHDLKADVVKEIEQLQLFIKDSLQTSAANSNSSSVLQVQFSKARYSYKQIEWAVEYFMPTTARFVNGPALDELEIEENTAFEPEGFQVMEELIYPVFDTSNRTELIRQCKILQSTCERMKKHFSAINFTEAQVIDALRLQVHRITGLGITGFDNPIALNGIEEAAWSLQSIDHYLHLFQQSVAHSSDKETTTLRQQLKNAIAFCQEQNNFETFDRAVFITQHLNPISIALYNFQVEAKIPFINDGRHFRSDAPTLFATNAFDVNTFIPSPEYKSNNDKVKLGERLFYDPVLSINNKRSCGSCHSPEKAFTDGLVTSTSLNGGFIKRNAASLNYASLQHGQFWDMRRPDLESQTADVIANKDEMHGSLNDAAVKLQQQVSYKTLFNKTFQSNDSIKIWQIQNALASYIRSLAVFNSRFDRYMNGYRSSLTKEEVSGMNLFLGKAKCGTCHFLPLFNGTVPPSFNKTESEVLGTPAADGIKPDNDHGRYAQHQMPQLLHSFKTPTVRNIALTAPYMHNGVYKTLEEVIEFYNKGGGAGLGFTVDNQTLPPDSLNLTAEEKKALIAFMHSLTDEKHKQ
ncbi:cytochrome-c peroxidase [Lacibacter sediminis]|uniref:Cytochrome-c peroxidase n=1 Tax=Lacibacter sediminis TaxID=2760713 RepID=A0A7G5XCW5_9BACT|nr:cytochrome c peroxidase [Lacibacter sediminis]QNA43318.1 cytochrome-c peroxidase [Lacibacter sediminis]